MAKSVANSVLDAALAKIATATTMTLCSQQPTTRTEAITTYKLADVTVDSGDFGSPADGDTSGRKMTVAAQSSVPVDATGDSNHVALCDGTELLYVTTHTGQTLTSGNTANIGTWDVEIADPA
jgi:hypothetical protein